MSKVFNTLVVGAGRIGAFVDKPENENVLSHAHGFSMNGFDLVGFVDTDLKKAKEASSIWGGQAFKTIAEAFGGNKIDVVCEAVGDEYHFEVLRELAHYDFKLVFAEKPLTTETTQAKKILDIYKQRNIAVAVNYTRRYVPEFAALKTKISDLGKFLGGTGFYGKGLIHNGSHLIDMLRFLVGDVKGISVYGKIFDYTEEDPSIWGMVNLAEGATFILFPIDCRFYTIFEMDLLFSGGRVKIDDSRFKIEEFGLQKHTVFAGYKILTKLREIKTSQDKAMQFASKNIYEFLTGKSQLKCTGEDAYKTLQSCLKFK